MKLTSFEQFQVEPRSMLLKISTDEGLCGWGEPVIPGRLESVAAAVTAISEHLIGRDPDQIEDIWQQMYRGGFFRGGPILMAAMAGIDQALWDLKGKRYGLPAYEFLGGRVRDRLQVYAWIGGSSPSELAAHARVRVTQGYQAIKMNGPHGGEMRWVDSFARVEDVVARVGAVRQAVGPAVSLAVDLHGVAHKTMAKILAKELDPLHLLFLEEPVLPENNEALREIAAHTSTPLATGERLYSRWDYKGLLQDGFIDIIQPDLSHAGGLSEVRKIGAMAEAYDVAVAPHCPLGPVAFAACLQFAACTPNVFIQEQVLDVHTLADGQGLRYLENPVAIAFADGFVSLPHGPGLGVVVDEAAVREAAARPPHWRVPQLRNADGTFSEW
jgi:galactonate dehydratase